MLNRVKFELDDIYVGPNGKEWKVVSWCDDPTVCLEEVATGRRVSFGINGLTSPRFVKLVTGECEKMKGGY